MVNINSLERDGLRQAELCPRHTMRMNTKNNLIPDRSQPGITMTAPTVRHRDKYATGVPKIKKIRGRENIAVGTWNVHSANGIQREIKVKGQKLGTVTSFKYLGAVVSDDGSIPEVLSRIAQATAALTKLKPIWRDNNISLGSKVKLMRSLLISIFLYACESWTLTAELEKRTQAFEMRCYRRLLNISFKDHVTNEEVRRKIQAAIGEYGELLTLVKKRKLRWFGHVSRSSGLAKTILQGTVKGKRKGGRQKKRWEDNIKEWTGMDFASSTREAENRSRWKGIVANSSVVPRRPPKIMG